MHIIQTSNPRQIDMICQLPSSSSTPRKPNHRASVGSYLSNREIISMGRWGLVHCEYHCRLIIWLLTSSSNHRVIVVTRAQLDDTGYHIVPIQSYTYTHRIGSWEILQETLIFHGKKTWFPVDFLINQSVDIYYPGKLGSPLFWALSKVPLESDFGEGFLRLFTPLCVGWPPTPQVFFRSVTGAK